MTENPLSALQLDILELESRFWKRDGSKIAAFRELHPLITRTGYYVALERLLHDPRAYAHDGGRYAAMLRRLARAAGEAATRRESWRAGELLEET